MTAFITDPADYLGESVTIRHGYRGEREVSVCGRDGCASLVWSDETHRGDVHGDEYQPRHAAVTS
jgi:hypothetical protein